VRVVDARGQIHTRTLEELEVYYRSVPTFKREFVLSAVFKGQPGVPEEINRLLEQSMNKRRSSQPKESSAGCIFKNPSSCPAGKLVDDLGLKNSTHGGARVSDIHGNFIVNDGEASASDVLGLIEQIKATVQEQRGIALETEVQIVGVDKTFIR
jgi:UDP-N-acetylenolpyruvoylglucosamine reductase